MIVLLELAPEPRRQLVLAVDVKAPAEQILGLRFFDIVQFAAGQGDQILAGTARVPDPKPRLGGQDPQAVAHRSRISGDQRIRNGETAGRCLPVLCCRRQGGLP